MNRILLLRVIHGLFAIYFILCLIYLYYAAIFSRIDMVLFIALISLGMEGLAVFVINKGDCPLIHIQRKIGDETPFFNLILPAQYAKQAIPFFVKIAWVGIGLLALRLIVVFGEVGTT